MIAEDFNFVEISMSDYIFRGSLVDLDPELFELTQLEAERQARKIILIPSESQAPLAVREALGSAFQNIYAEGYPSEESRFLEEIELFDYPSRLSEYRRYSDPRYYKGVEYADIAEALARRRCAELFSANGFSANDIYVNVQPLSGAPANNAVYHALSMPGDTIMGMNLFHGGHLSHGSPANRSGKYYNAISYGVDPITEKLDYDSIEQLAQEHRPKFIIAGFSSYPWTVDWIRFRSIADSVGAYLFADIAHVAGLVAGGVFPSPIGFADVITFTTHKSLCGPRGACILTTDQLLAKKIDRAVFPGEQGGPHVNVFIAMALAFDLAKTEKFSELQKQVVRNAIALADRLGNHGFTIPFGGTDTHLVNLDCRSVIGEDGTPLSGDQAARLLDIAGIVVNRNTIPSDTSAIDPSGIRMGTPWITQRGFKEQEINQIADLIADLLLSIKPYSIPSTSKSVRRAKVNFSTLEQVKISTRELANKAGLDYKPSHHGYPHFSYIDDVYDEEFNSLEICGDKVREFLNFAFASETDQLEPGQSQTTQLHLPNREVIGAIVCDSWQKYHLIVDHKDLALTASWLRDLSDGFVEFDEDLQKKLPGPMTIIEKPSKIKQIDQVLELSSKPYYVGISDDDLSPLPDFNYDEANVELKRTPIYNTHLTLGGKIIPFAGWEMPVWYSSVYDEHLAVRKAAGVFDVTHMGVYQVEGPDAYVFLNCVVGNDVSSLRVGESCYTHFLDPFGNVLDDLLVYRRGIEKFMLVVNAANDDKDWKWLNEVKNGEVRVSVDRPWSRCYGKKLNLRNLKSLEEGDDMRVDIALQGPRSREILLSLGVNDLVKNQIMRLKRTKLIETRIGSFDLVVSRTGYTGEKMAFELFVHPDRAEELFNSLLECGQEYGLKPIGLGARDSLRTEAGLPLYGHELAGKNNLSVGEAGFSSYIKAYKPWFIGRSAYLNQERLRKGTIVRFRFDDKNVRVAHYNDPVLDKRGKVIGFVTSCAIDSDGFLTGQAFVDLKYAEENVALLIYQSASTKAEKSPAELNRGDRVTVPGSATVIRRFPKL